MSTTRRRGSVLIIVMVVAFAIAAMVLTLGRQARVQALASSNDLAAQKADAAERGAEQYVLSLLTDYRDTLPSLTETDFSAVQVGDAYFWIVRPTYNDATLPAWGLLDESGKVDLNQATEDQLLLLPNMTQDIADAIVAWRGNVVSTDPTAAANTSSNSTVTTATAGVKNAPFETVDELLLVPGVTHDWLYGPPAAANATANAPSANDNWSTAHGMFDYFTISAWNTQPNTDPTGSPRLSYNPPDSNFATMLTTQLGTTGSEVMTQISAPVGGGGRRRPTAPPPIADLFAFADRATLLKTDDLAKIENYMTNDSAKTSSPGLINVDTAPRDVLTVLEAQGLSSANIDTLLTSRADAIAANPGTIGWVRDAIPDIESSAPSIANQLTGQGRQFSADIVAACANGRGFRHVRIVVDSTSSPSRIVYRRDLTDRGWPMDAAVLEQLKSGTFAGGNASAAPAPMGAH